MKSQTLFMASLVENAIQDSLDKLIRRENVTTTDTRHPRTGKAQTHSSHTHGHTHTHIFKRPDTFELLRMEMQIGEAYKHFSAIIISLIEAETCPRVDALTSHREYPVSSERRGAHELRKRGCIDRVYRITLKALPMDAILFVALIYKASG